MWRLPRKTSKDAAINRREKALWVRLQPELFRKSGCDRSESLWGCLAHGPDQSLAGSAL